MTTEEVSLALSLLFEPGQVVEVRAITEEGMASGYFDDPAALVAVVEPLDATGTAGIYVTLNEVDPALLSRRANRVKMRLSKKDATTADSDIVRRRWFPVDIDPVRPSGVSSTDQEHKAALARAREIAAYLTERGWPDPVLADSGNGAHLLYRIDLPNDEESRDLVKRALEALDVMFSDKVCTVDTANHNAARIWKLYGTTSRKGDNTRDRPYRTGKILVAPDHIGIVGRDLLEKLATSLPVPEQPAQKSTSHCGQKIDLRSWLASHGIQHRRRETLQRRNALRPRRVPVLRRAPRRCLRDPVWKWRHSCRVPPRLLRRRDAAVAGAPREVRAEGDAIGPAEVPDGDHAGIRETTLSIADRGRRSYP